MEKICWTDRVGNEVLHSQEERNVLKKKKGEKKERKKES